MIYDKTVVQQETLKWFKGDELATQVWLSKYALKNKTGEYTELIPNDRFDKIASAIFNVESKFGGYIPSKDVILNSLVNGEIIPAGSGLYGIANPYSTSSLGNCFVISHNGEDSYGSIMKVDEELVQIAKRRGGIGFDISGLRPAGTPVSNSAGFSSGAISFMPRYSNSTREVAQDGRRGALMLTMHVNHPDILGFVKAKRDLTKITGANVSIKITDEFMRTVQEDGLHYYRYPVEGPIEYIRNSDEISGSSPETKWGFIKARELWDEIVKSNWIGAEPGILFWDKIISESPADCYPGFKTESTNPCSELPLSPYDSCRLLSINLVPIVLDPFTAVAKISWSKFENSVRLAIRMMDNIVELEIEKIKAILAKINSDPESNRSKAVERELWTKILKNTQDGRRLGTSIIGHADMLASLGLAYDSKEGLDLIEELHEKFRDWAYDESVELSIERGAFPAFDASKEVNNPFINRLPEDLKDKMRTYGRRNIALLTIPPAGSLAIILRTSSGIEPIFNLYYTRKRKVNPGTTEGVVEVDATGDSWQEYNLIHPGLQRWWDVVGPYSSKTTIKQLKDMPTEMLDSIIKDSPYYGCTANEIDPLFKAKMQGTIQKYIDHGISVTYNLPEKTKEETISNIYFTAWTEGVKGCTIYREGSRSGVLINKKKKTDEKNGFSYHDAPKRPRVLPCDVHYPTIRGEKYVVLVGLYNGKPYETMALKDAGLHLDGASKDGFIVKQRSTVYNLTDKKGNVIVEDLISKFDSPEWDAITRLTSTALRHGADINFIVEQLEKSSGTVVDVTKVIARTLKRYVKVQEIAKGKPCPNCGEPLVIEGGCEQCVNIECAYGKCS